MKDLISEGWVLLHPGEEAGAIERSDFGVTEGPDTGGAHAAFEQSHLAEEFSGAKQGEADFPSVGAANDLDDAGVDDIHAIGGIALMDDVLPVAELLAGCAVHGTLLVSAYY